MTSTNRPMKGTTVLVYGLAIAGEAVARALVARGAKVIVADDAPSEHALAVARELGVDLYEKPPEPKLDRLVERCDLVVPSPGIAEDHPLNVSCARAGTPQRTEIDLAFEWEQSRPDGPRPMLAVTGTDGKTTTTLMATAMLHASGVRAIDAGNTDTPLVTALDLDVDAFVVECTSFRLAHTSAFAPAVAAWLNLAPDHLDWHRSMATYEEAKARIWVLQSPSDVAIGFHDDPIVMARLAKASARQVTFGAAGADYRVADGRLVGPRGVIAEVASMKRALPHDLTNALCAAAMVLESGTGTIDGVAEALAEFAGVPHRIALVGDIDGVRWYDDSKATTPHAAITAVRAFDHVVLIAGGRNKGLDLAAMGTSPERMRGVVAIGEAGPIVADVFVDICPVVSADSMDGAIEAAATMAVPGDAVLLSPGCASYDWYSGYGARGDDFARAVRAHIGRQP